MQTEIMASKIVAGQTIMPPAREIRLWMRKYLIEKGLPESALHMTVTATRQAMPDKKGPWIIITAVHSEAWLAGNKSHPWDIKVRPDTLWPVIGEARS